MGLRTDKQEIGGYETTCTQFDVMRSMRTGVKLTKIIAPALAGLKGLSELSLNTDLSVLLPALTEALAALEAQDSDALVLELLEKTTVLWDGDGGQLKMVELNRQSSINTVFAGRLMDLMSTVLFAVATNYRDFLDGVSLPSLNGATEMAEAIASEELAEA